MTDVVWALVCGVGLFGAYRELMNAWFLYQSGKRNREVQ